MIIYIKGDATQPRGDGPKILIHVCNDRGGWGRGFVVAISKRWGSPKDQYKKWFRETTDPDAGRFELGSVALVEVEPELWVANMIAQEGYGPSGDLQHRPPGDSSTPIRYQSLKDCLTKVARAAREKGATIHAPRIGCGLAGGSWAKVEPLIQETMADLRVFIYDL